ncbi:MAG: hypothetical protein ACYTBJ_00185 [Planctomycetota bacterium]|jgi:hypothetical protein
MSDRRFSYETEEFREAFKVIEDGIFKWYHSAGSKVLTVDVQIALNEYIRDVDRLVLELGFIRTRLDQDLKKFGSYF